MDVSRRDVLGSSVALLVAGGAATTAGNTQGANTYGAALTGLGITSALARPFALKTCRLPQYTRRSARCSIGSGARSLAVRIRP